MQEQTQETLKFPDGTTIHIQDGRLHREDGPALQTPDGTEYHFIDGALHRDNGPAIVCADPQHCHWYKHGIRIPSRERSQSLISQLRHQHLGIAPVGKGSGSGSSSASGSASADTALSPGSNTPRKPRT